MTEQTFESYEFITDWKCPSCNKVHSKPHFAFPDQVDETKKPNELGRIKSVFKRERDEFGNKVTCEQYVKQQGTGPVTIDGKQAPLFCSHCGWHDDLIYITKEEKKKRR
ncbi:MAG: hypothetical protein DA328_09190 [Nitrososphaeraceae archaeon]|nr:hypothetical protein [Nitrososphaeraceae archaeon]